MPDLPPDSQPHGPEAPLHSMDVEAFLEQAGCCLQASLERYTRNLLSSLERSLVAQFSGRQETRRVRDAFRQATAEVLPGFRPARVSTDAVIDALRVRLAGRREGVLVTQLRQETGYSAMQVHRGLARMEASGEVRRSGSPRRTRYHPTRRLKSTRHLKGRSPDRHKRSKPVRQGTPPAKRPQEEADMLRLLGRSRTGVSRSELQQHSGYSRPRVQRALARLVSEGLVERLGSGPTTRYRRCTPASRH